MSSGRFARRIHTSVFAAVIALFGISFFWPLESGAVAVSPLRQTIVLDAGFGEDVVITVKNDAQDEVVIRPAVDAFRIDNKTGRAIFGAHDNALAWIVPVGGEFTLGPGEERDMRFHIFVPTSTPPGGHYLGLFAEQSSRDAMVGITSRIGTLLFLYVSGDVSVSMVPESFTTDKRLYTTLPINIDLRIINTGAIHAVPAGELRVVDMWGREVYARSINTVSRKVLPGDTLSAREIVDTLTWRNAGLLTATVVLSTSPDMPTVSRQISFWFVPIGVHLPIVLVLMVGLVVFLVRRKRYAQAS